ncbi:FAD-dependent oxidoreductase [Actinophytocola sp.]|uniref:FAD-dependent oxidoreductase n=1 Tax=Actinophytocola sp. TaxID=1872138 RepID=UPI003D6C5F11
MSSDDDLTVDTIVVGGGMGGLTAGSYAARNGKSVLLVEKSEDVGGTSMVSGGVLWTAPTFGEWRERCPEAEEPLGRALVDGFPEVWAWLAELNVDIEPPVLVHDFAPGRPFDIIGYFRRAVSIIESAGGFVMRSTVVRRLVLDGSRVTGAVLRDADGTEVTVRADAVVLATGGLQGDPDARARYIHPNAATVAVRANQHSVGDGLRLAIAAGADVHGTSPGFYGHLICAPLDRFTDADFTPLYQHYSHLCALLNLDGVRFTVEKAGDHFNAQALVPQRDSRGLLVFDDRVYRTAVITPNVERFAPYDKFELARSRGANTASADTLDELATKVAGWGFKPDRIAASVAEFNTGEGSLPTTGIPMRVSQVRPLTAPPFYAMEVEPAVTFAHSGLRIDDRARVLGKGGEPIAGLYACGADVGGVYDRGYCGGLALASVFGIVAARDLTAAGR